MLRDLGLEGRHNVQNAKDGAPIVINRQTRVWGGLCLVSGMAMFALFLALL